VHPTDTTDLERAIAIRVQSSIRHAPPHYAQLVDDMAPSLGSFHSPPPGLRGLHHVSKVCADLDASAAFYQEYLGFIPIKRPSGLRFDGL
jgi:hypothetical protein